MSEYANYDSTIQSIISSNNAADDKYKAVGKAASTLCDINQTAVQVQNMTVVHNRGGEVIGYDYRYTPPAPTSPSIAVDSNSDNGQYATGGGGQTSGGGAGRYRGSYYAGQVDTSETSDKMGSTGLVSGLISSAWAGVSVLAKFGRNVAGAAADAIETLGAGVGSAFNNLFVDAANVTGDAIRALFGVDSQGNTTMYLDEDVIGAYAIKSKEGGFLTDSDEPPTIEVDWDSISSNLYFDWSGVGISALPTGYWRYGVPSACTSVTFDADYCIKYRIGTGNYILSFIKYDTSGDSSVAILETTKYLTQEGGSERYIYGSRMNDEGLYSSYYRYNVGASSNWLLPSLSEVMASTGRGQYIIGTPGSFIQLPSSATDSQIMHDIITILSHSTIVYPSTIDGISPQPSSISPVDAITGADPHVVAQQLANQYPQIMGSPIQITTMDDSCNEVTKNYYSVPISYSPTNLNINVPITGGTQNNPTFNPDVTIDLPDINKPNYIDQIIKVLQGDGQGEDITTEPVPEDDPDKPSDEIDGGGQPIVVPQTGEGDTPPTVPPTVDVNSMWHVYNPQVEGLTGLGTWLWSNSIWQQIVEMFTNPMEAIMGVHAIYCAPDIGSQVPIVVGYLTSTANANIVTSQYKELSCGSIWLTEYFGNVYDYEPFTTLQLYLPYVGIVPLSVADCMRAEISISYVIDFYTGACVAKVSVNRDGAGGVLYEYPGNCAVEYPVSGASYSRMLQSIVASAASAVAVGIRTAGAPGTSALGALAAGATFVSGGEKMQVQHSGSFGGNHGAMGSKIPYLIISRPQTNMAINFEYYDGYRSNYLSQLSSCKGYTKCKEVHLNCPGAYKQELDEIESLLRSGVLFSTI